MSANRLQVRNIEPFVKIYHRIVAYLSQFLYAGHRVNEDDGSNGKY